MTSPTAPFRADVPEPEFVALVTIETVERLTAKASAALESGDLDRVRALFGAIVDETTIRTCTAVKALGLSDRIARAARADVTNALRRVEADLAAQAAQAEAEHDAATDRSIAEHEADLATRLDY